MKWSTHWDCLCCSWWWLVYHTIRSNGSLTTLEGPLGYSGLFVWCGVLNWKWYFYVPERSSGIFCHHYIKCGSLNVTPWNRYTCIDIEMIDIAVSFIEIKIRNDYMRNSMSYDVKLSLYDYATRTPLRGYADQRGAFVSAAEILMRIYKNPIHLNGARWRTRFLTQRKIRWRKKC